MIITHNKKQGYGNQMIFRLTARKQIE